jgi:hypothetical protein
MCGLVLGRSPNDENSLEASVRGLFEVMYGHLPGGNEENTKMYEDIRYSGRD